MGPRIKYTNWLQRCTEAQVTRDQYGPSLRFPSMEMLIEVTFNSYDDKRRNVGRRKR